MDKTLLNKYKMGDQVVTATTLVHETYECCLVVPKGIYADVCEVYDDKNIMLQVPVLEKYGANCLIDCSSDQVEPFNEEQFLSQFKIGKKVKIQQKIKIKTNEYVPIGTEAIINSINKDEWKANIQITYKNKSFDIDFGLLDLLLSDKPQIEFTDKLNYNYKVGDKITMIQSGSDWDHKDKIFPRGTQGVITAVGYEYVEFDIKENGKVYHLSSWVDDVCKSCDFKSFYKYDHVVTLVDKINKNGIKIKAGTHGGVENTDNYPKIVVKIFIDFNNIISCEYFDTELKYIDKQK